MHVIHIILVYIFIALAVYCRSPSAYDALKSFGILQLPSKSTLQSFTANFLHDPGANKSCIADQVTKYLLFCTQLQDETKKESKKDGVRILDEVKVINRLLAA